MAISATTVLNPIRVKGHLLRIVGVGFGVAVGIGNTIGSGILRTPGEVAAQLRSSFRREEEEFRGSAYFFRSASQLNITVR